jgi:hypothetical protein
MASENNEAGEQFSWVVILACHMFFVQLLLPFLRDRRFSRIFLKATIAS